MTQEHDSSTTSRQATTGGTNGAAEAPASGRNRWAFIVTGLLLGHVGAMALAVNIASGDAGDTGHAVLPEYYQRALDWDAKQRSLAASDALGWRLSSTVATFRSDDGSREIRLELTTGTWEPVVGAAVHVRIWHHAVGTVVEVPAHPTDAPGVYVANAPMDRTGIWQCETRAARGDERFVDDRELRVARLGPAVETGAR